MASYRWSRFKKNNMMPSIPVTSTERSSKAPREMSQTSETSKEKKKTGAKRFSKSFIPKKEDSPNPTQSERNTMSLTPTQSEDNRNILIPTLSEDNTKSLTPTQFEDNTNVLIPTLSEDNTKSQALTQSEDNTSVLIPTLSEDNTNSQASTQSEDNTNDLIPTQSKYKVLLRGGFDRPMANTNKTNRRSPTPDLSKESTTNTCRTDTKSLPPNSHRTNTKSTTRNPVWINTTSPPPYPHVTNTKSPTRNPYWTNTKSTTRNPYWTNTYSPPPYPFGTNTKSPPSNPHWKNTKSMAQNCYEPKTNRLTRSTYWTDNPAPNTSLVDTMRRNPSMTYSDSLLLTHFERNTSDSIPMSSEEIMNSTNLLPGGLPNLGSTCYVNSSLQYLFTAEAFCKELFNLLNHSKHNKQDPFLRCFVKLSTLRETWPVLCDTKELLMELIQLAADTQLDFSIYQQNDAHEFLLHCLTKLEQSGTRLGAVDPVRSNFIFNMRNIITCLRCKSQQKSKIEENRHIFLPLVHSSVNQCLDGMLYNTEVLQCKCESCGADYASSRWAFHTLPRFLIIQLNRFCMEVSRIVKLRTPINIDPELKIHCPSRSDTPGTKNSKAKASQSDRNDLGGSTATYRLISVLSHVGSELNSGHYVSDCFTHNSDQWKHYNDQVVTLTTEAAVLALRSSDAYVLLYERK